MLNIKEQEEQNMLLVIKAAREIQEYLWEDMNDEVGLEEFKRMLRKRLMKLEKVRMSNPHWKVEFKKRLLQIAAISVNLLTKINNGTLKSEGIHPTKPSNLLSYTKSSVYGDKINPDALSFDVEEDG